MIIELQASRMDVEHHIAPPLYQVVTLPVLIDGKPTAAVVYVGTSAFGPQGEDGLTDEQVQAIAVAIGGRRIL